MVENKLRGQPGSPPDFLNFQRFMSHLIELDLLISNWCMKNSNRPLVAAREPKKVKVGENFIGRIWYCFLLLKCNS